MSSVGPQRAALLLALGGFSIAALFVWYIQASKKKKLQQEQIGTGKSDRKGKRQAKEKTKEEENKDLTPRLDDESSNDSKESANDRNNERAHNEERYLADRQEEGVEESERDETDETDKDEASDSEAENTEGDVKDDSAEASADEQELGEQSEDEPTEGQTVQHGRQLAGLESDSGHENETNEMEKAEVVEKAKENEDVNETCALKHVELPQATEVSEKEEADEREEKTEISKETGGGNSLEQQRKPIVTEKKEPKSSVSEEEQPKCMASCSSSSEMEPSDDATSEICTKTSCATLGATDAVKIPELRVQDENKERKETKEQKKEAKGKGSQKQTTSTQREAQGDGFESKQERNEKKFERKASGKTLNQKAEEKWNVLLPRNYGSYDIWDSTLDARFRTPASLVALPTSPSLRLDVGQDHNQPFSWSEEMANSPSPTSAPSIVQPQQENEQNGQEQRESPGAISQNSEASSGDSGRATGGLASSLSPMEEPNYDNMPMYEFEIPNSLVGLIIGIKGKTIRELSVRTNVKMLIRQHHTPEKVNTHQICQVRGKREEINHCLSMLRRRFPPLRFPELNLNPVLPPLLSNGFVDALHTQPTWLTLPENVPCEVVVSSIMSPSHFFLQQPTHPTYASLSLLDMYMMRLYSQDVDIPELPTPCQDGLLCAAPVGGNWLRAVTFGHDAEKDDVSIRYVDYGGYGRLKRSELRQIRTDLMSLPFQSTECYLAYVQPVDGTRVWSDAAVEFFKNLVLGRLITATLVGYHVEDRMPMIELLVQNEEKKTIRLDTALMEKGYAKAADPSKMQRLNTLQRQQSQGQQNGVPPPPNQQNFQHQMQHPPPPLIQGMQNGHTPHQQQGHQNGIAPLINGNHQPKRPVYTSQQYGHHSGHSGSHHSAHTHAAHNQPHPQAVNKQHRQNF